MRGGFNGPRRRNKLPAQSRQFRLKSAAQISETAVMLAASPDALPNDADALRALVLAEQAAKRLLREERDGLAAERDALNAANEKLHHIIAVLRRARFGRKSERLSDGFYRP